MTKVKGQSHTITKNVTVAQLLVTCTAEAVSAAGVGLQRVERWTGDQQVQIVGGWVQIVLGAKAA